MTPAEYLLGVACLLLWIGLLLFSADRLASRLVAVRPGPASLLATLLIAVSLGLATAILPGLVGLLSPVSLLFTTALIAIAVGVTVEPGRPGDGPITESVPGPGRLLSFVGLLLGSLASAVFLVRSFERTGTGMTGFDTTWYHAPIAAEFIESGDVLSLHQVAPQFLTWFYPHNSELLHAAIGTLFGGDLPSLVLGIVWFGGSLLAAWVIGSRGSAAPLSVAGVALAIGSFAFADQAGEARNDLAGTFFLLAGIGVAAAAIPRLGEGPNRARGVVFMVALAAGLAAGTKLNFLLPGLVLAAGSPFLVERPERIRAALPAAAGFLAGGAFWYFRNLVQSGNPLPWVSGLGPIPLPGPDQERGGRDPGSILDYMDDPGVILDSFVPNLAEGLGQAWPILLVLAAVGLALSFRRPLDRPLAIGAATGIAAVAAWFIGPTSASGPEGDPVGFLSGLRYLVPGLAIALALLGPSLNRLSTGAARAVAVLMLIVAPFTLFSFLPAGSLTGLKVLIAAGLVALTLLVVVAVSKRPPGPLRVWVAGVALVALVPLGYLVQGRYLDDRYAAPDFVAPGLGEAFTWAQGEDGVVIGTTATRSYPLYGPRFDNRVASIGLERPNGGFIRAGTCREFIGAVDRGGFDRVVVSLDREGVKRDYPPEVRWLDRDPAAAPLFRTPPTAVFAIEGRLDPDRCPPG